MTRAVKTVLKQTELRLILKEAHKLLTERLLVELLVSHMACPVLQSSVSLSRV